MIVSQKNNPRSFAGKEIQLPAKSSLAALFEFLVQVSWFEHCYFSSLKSSTPERIRFTD